MATIICPMYGKAVQDNQKFCQYCGYLIELDYEKQTPIRLQKNGWASMRKGFSITDLVLGVMFFIMIVT